MFSGRQEGQSSLALLMRSLQERSPVVVPWSSSEDTFCLPPVLPVIPYFLQSGRCCINAIRAHALKCVSLPCRILFKQRDNRFYPPSAWSLSLLLVRIPFQLMEALLYSCIVYFWVGELLLSEAFSLLRWPGGGPCQPTPCLGL